MAEEKNTEFKSGEEEQAVPSCLTNLPDWEPNTAAYPEMARFQFKGEKDARAMEAAFNALIKILNNKKEECMKFANESVNNYKKSKGKKGAKGGSRRDASGAPVKAEATIVDIDHCKSELFKLATRRGELEYDLMVEEKACITLNREHLYFQDFNYSAKLELEQWQEMIRAEEENLNLEKDGYKKALQSVLKPLAAANKQLKGITANTLKAAVKVTGTPPPKIQYVVKAVLMMLGEMTVLNEKYYQKWPVVVKKFHDSSFNVLDRMLTFDFDIKDEKALQSRDRADAFLQKKNITYETAKQANKTVGVLALWLIKTITLTKLRQEVAPVELKIDEMSVVKKHKEKQAKKLQELMDDNEKHMRRLQGEITNVVRKINILRDEIEAESAKTAEAKQEEKKE